MTHIYKFIVRAFEVLFAVLFLGYLFTAITTNSVAAVLAVLIGFVLVLGVWSVLMLILRSMQDNGETLRQISRKLDG